MSSKVEIIKTLYCDRCFPLGGKIDWTQDDKDDKKLKAQRESEFAYRHRGRLEVQAETHTKVKEAIRKGGWQERNYFGSRGFDLCRDCVGETAGKPLVTTRKASELGKSWLPSTTPLEN